MTTQNTTASGAADRPEALKLASILRGLDTRHYFGNKKLVAAADELERLHALAASAPVAPTPPSYALVPLKVPASLYPRLTGYEKPAPGDHHSDHDRQEIESRSAKAWGEIVQAASTQPSTHARNDALADEIVELLDSCECLENGQKENALAIVKRMCSAQFEHSEAQ